MPLLSVGRKVGASLDASAHFQSPRGSTAPIVFPMRPGSHAQAVAKNLPLPAPLIVSDGSAVPYVLLFLKWSSKKRKKWPWFTYYFYGSIAIRGHTCSRTCRDALLAGLFLNR